MKFFVVAGERDILRRVYSYCWPPQAAIFVWYDNAFYSQGVFLKRLKEVADSASLATLQTTAGAQGSGRKNEELVTHLKTGKRVSIFFDF